MLTDLDDELCDFLLTALRVWGGPGGSSDYFARSLDFADNEAFHSNRLGIIDALEGGEGLETNEFQLVIRLARIAVFDDYYGAGSEWSLVSRFSVEEASAMIVALEAMSGTRGG